MSNVVIARNIRMLRSKLGISQQELAKNAGVSGGYLCDCERGRRTPSVNTLSKIAAALNCRISDIIEERSAG